MEGPGIRGIVAGYPGVHADQNLMLTAENSGGVPSRDEKLIKESGQEADRVCRKQKEISAAATALVNLSESIGVRKR